MTKYLLNRILRGILSIVIVVGVVMVLVYTFMDRKLILANDPLYTKQMHNAKEAYKYQQWERYGYLDYVPYADYLIELLKAEEITQETYNEAVKFGKKASDDSPLAAEYIEKFTQTYEDQGYEIIRLDAKLKPGTKKYHPGGEQRLFAVKDVPLMGRLWNYLTDLFFIDNINYVEEDIEERGLTFTLYDPAYGGNQFAPAIIGNGTKHKYLIYTNDTFPFVHQNMITLNLGESYAVNTGEEVFDVMTRSQGSYKMSTVLYPTGLEMESADNIHSATYIAGSLENGTTVIKDCFTDDYTNVSTNKNGLSGMGYSFVIGILSVILAYLLAVPLGISMALKKDKLIDKLGTFYMIFL